MSASTASAGHAGGLGQLRAELYERDNLTVGQRALTVTADAKSRAYGDANPALTYQVGGSGLVNGDTLSGALATSATTASNVGTYGIGQGTLAASGNYALNYTGNDLTVGQRALTVTADAKSRAYGDVNPALTYQVGGSGLVNGDTPVGCAGDVGDDCEQCRHLRHRAGNARSLGQLRAELYGQRPDRRPARAHRHGRCQEPRLRRCQSRADLSGRGSGLVNGDSLSGALATSATTASNVGAYGIAQGSLAASTNYALNYTSANLTIAPRASPSRLLPPRCAASPASKNSSFTISRAWFLPEPLSAMPTT